MSRTLYNDAPRRLAVQAGHARRGEPACRPGPVTPLLRHLRTLPAIVPELVIYLSWLLIAVYRALAELDLLLVPSAPAEATTRVILEAFAAGVPVIAFASGGIPEVIEHGRTGLLVNSVDEMAACARALLWGEAARRCSITRSAREAWQSRFTTGRYQSQLLEAVKVAARN